MPVVKFTGLGNGAFIMRSLRVVSTRLGEIMNTFIRIKQRKKEKNHTHTHKKNRIKIKNDNNNNNNNK